MTAIIAYDDSTIPSQQRRHDGEDDGGPAARGADAENGSDDVGLRMPVP